jgi:peptidyl-prolyl cis-trans isomerase A (cyclophilin A)
MLAQTPAPTKSDVAAGQPSAALMNPAALNAQAPDVCKVKFTTTKGDFVVEVRRAWAPRGADRFYNLVKNGFFTDASFFRVVSGFVVQFGLPADPKIARVWQTATFPDDPVKQSNVPGTLVFATAGPNTRTTQLFINLGDNARLDSDGFSPFGKIAEGMGVVQKLYSGYGDMRSMGGKGPDQGPVVAQGKAYLDKNFPSLDSIKSATIISEEAAPASKKSKK